MSNDIKRAMETEHAKLTLRILDKLLANPSVSFPNDKAIVDTAYGIAKETINCALVHLHGEDEDARAAVEKRKAEKLARGKIPINWEPEKDSPTLRNGYKWSDAERQALGDGLRNGESVRDLVLRHRRSANAIMMQLEAQGLLDQDDNGRFIDRETGEVLA